MIPYIVKEIVINRLNQYNSFNPVKFAARFRENYIFLDVSESIITSIFCKIEYGENNNYVFVQYYNSSVCQFEEKKVKYKKEILVNNLELLLLKHNSFKVI